MQALLVPRFRRHLAVGLAAIGALFATALVLGAARAESPEEAMGKSTGPLVLVTRAEIDALPDEVPVVWGRNWDSPDGPVIAIDSPQNGATYGVWTRRTTSPLPAMSTSTAPPSVVIASTSSYTVTWS